MMNKVEEHIRKAIREGQFDDLPGKGKPLNLEENPFEDPEWHMAYRFLHNGGYTLPWIEKRRDIETELGVARTALKRSWTWRKNALATGTAVAMVSSEWSQAVESFRKQIDQINEHIFAYNLEVPSERFGLPLLDVERELDLTASPASDTLPDSTTK